MKTNLSIRNIFPKITQVSLNFRFMMITGITGLIITGLNLWFRPILSSGANKTNQVLATVNGQKIYSEDFIDFYKTRPRVARWASSEETQNDPKEILDALIGKVLMTREAYKLYPHLLKGYSREIADFEQRCMIDAFSEKEINQGIQVSEEEIIKRIPEERKIEVHLRRLVVSSGDEAQRLKEQLEKGADFATLAKKFSLAEEAEKGGDIGYMSFDQGIFPKKVVEEIFKLKIGQFTQPSKVRDGFAVFQVIGQRKIDKDSLERVKQFIRQEITLERQRQRWDQLLEQLKKESSVIMNEALLKEIEQKLAKTQGEAPLEQMGDLEIAKVKDRSVKLKEIIPGNIELSFGGNRPWERDTALLRRLLDRHLRVLMVSDHARQLHYDQSRDVKKNVARFKDDLMVKALIAEKVYKGLDVKVEESRRYYRDHLSEYQIPEQVSIAQIVTQDKKTAINLLHQVNQGTDFTKLSSKYPAIEPFTLKGFWVKGGSGLGAEFESQVFKLTPGQISNIIKTSQGFHIVKLLDRKKEGPAEFTEVEANIREKLLLTKKEKALEDYMATLRDKSKITISNPHLKEIINDAT